MGGNVDLVTERTVGRTATMSRNVALPESRSIENIALQLLKPGGHLYRPSHIDNLILRKK